MLILLDIGNTSVTYGVYKKAGRKSFASSLFINIPKILKNIVKSGANRRIKVIISSVVPKNTRILKNMLSRYKNVQVFIVGENLRIPVKKSYKSKKLGIDRLVNVYGALKSAPALVIDYGTAITFDYVSKKGVFEGGLIVPGPQVSFQALIEKAALLPKKILLPKKATSFLGKTTYDCMASGILEAYGSLTDELINRFKAKFGRLTVIATGGFVQHLKPYIHQRIIIDPKHSIKSLFLLARSSGLISS